VPLYKFYSFKLKEFVDGSLVETYKDKGKFKYKLKKGGSAVVIVPKILSKDKELVHKIYTEVLEGGNIFDLLKKHKLRIGGTESITSTIKKTYILKEKTPKLKNAIRLFVKLGANCDILYDTYKWNGYLAVGLEEVLSILGYAVNIVGIYGTNEDINANGDGNLVSGTRFNAINLKRFDESLDKGGMLYICSDQTFFRLKMFDNYVKEFEYYDDHFDTRFGSSASDGQLKDVIYREYGKRDNMWNKKSVRENNCQFLYYIIADVHSEQELSRKILDISLDIINENQEAREKF
jgi:hypothetical protein